MDEQDLSMMKGGKRVKGRNGRAAGIAAAAVLGVIYILAVASGSQALEIAVADGTLTPWAYLPHVSIQKTPTPYNVSARSIALRPSDLPGYTLVESATGPADFLWEIPEVVQMGLIDGYRVWYNSDGDELTAYELATVFQTPQGAHSYLQWEKENRLTDWVPVSCLRLGDETIAYCVEDEYWALCDIVFRKDNLAVLISHGGVPGKVRFSNALSIASVALARLNSQIGEEETTASNGTLIPWAYLPLVSRQEPPTPYNVRAESIVLQLSDMPSGYALDEEESGPVDLSDTLLQMGAVEGCEVTYTNYDLFFTGTPIVYNLAIVFRTTDGARSYIQQVRQNIIDDPEGTLVSCPTLGDETVAGRLEAEDGSYVAYVIAFRKGNLAAGIGTGGLLGVAKFSDALSFARKALERINDQTGASVRATGRGGKRPETVVESASSWVSVSTSQHIRDLWAVLWMGEN